jgi:hypothetical protein
MNTGIGDAMNLGWNWLRSCADQARNGCWTATRPSGIPSAPVSSALTDALNQLVLGRSAIRRLVRRLTISSILRFPLSRRLAAERLTGIGIAYPRRSREDDRLVGRRMPDIECDGTRPYEVLRSGRFVLVTAAGTDSNAVDWPGVDHVVHTDRTLPAAILVRPDGYIAWATRRPPEAAQLSAVLSRWCGQRAKDQCTIR